MVFPEYREQMLTAWKWDWFILLLLFYVDCK